MKVEINTPITFDIRFLEIKLPNVHMPMTIELDTGRVMNPPDMEHVQVEVFDRAIFRLLGSRKMGFPVYARLDGYVPASWGIGDGGSIDFKIKDGCVENWEIEDCDQSYIERMLGWDHWVWYPGDPSGAP